MKLRHAIEKRWYSEKPSVLACLFPLEYLFKTLSARRKARYTKHATKNLSHPPLIVVGNLSVGGTGKTPVIIALTSLLQEQGLKVGIVSRGYGRNASHVVLLNDDSQPEDVGDEPLEIYQRCRCDIVVGADRAAAVTMLVEQCSPDVILSDDGLQHYRMQRDLELVIVNANQGFGNGHCLPVGPLREPVERLHEVDFVLINGKQEPHSSLKNQALDKRSTFSVVAKNWVNLHSGKQEALNFIPSNPIRAYAGIGQPQKFFSMLESLGIEAECHAKSDHAIFEAADFSDHTISYLITAKDAVKCKHIASMQTWYLEVQAQFDTEFKQMFLARVQKLLDRKNT